MPILNNKNVSARDNQNFLKWFDATDLLLDSIAEMFQGTVEGWTEASPEERLKMLEAMLHQAVKEFFREPRSAIRSSALTPDEKAIWQEITNQKDKNPKKYY